MDASLAAAPGLELEVAGGETRAIWLANLGRAINGAGVGPATRSGSCEKAGSSAVGVEASRKQNEPVGRRDSEFPSPRTTMPVDAVVEAQGAGVSAN